MSDQATYCPEDDKIRLYVGRVPRNEYLRLRAEKWISTPKQDCDFVGKWSPAKEDTALEYAEYIDDEDQSPEERAADRAERFSMYRDKRRAEAHGHADAFDAGPGVHGYQNQDRADRAACRHDKGRVRAYTQWDKAEYWQTRTAGVISHALYKSSASVRRGRVLIIEKEQRLLKARVEDAKQIWEAWKRVKAEADPEKAYRLAYQIANTAGSYHDYQHPRIEDVKGSLYHLLTYNQDKITGAEAAQLSLKHYNEDGPGCKGSYTWRWLNHYDLRLAYENQMIEAEGGKVTEIDIIPGGFIGKWQIQKVNKSPITKRVVSVNIKHDWGHADIGSRSVYVDWGGVVNVERLGEDAYRAPTEAELAEFKDEQNQRKAKRKAANSGKPKLINPTLEDAQRLQDALNKAANERKQESYKRQSYTWNPERDPVEPAKVWPMTQGEYKARSAGSYGCCCVEELQEGPKLYKKSNIYTKRVERKTVCKLRRGHSSGNCFYMADRIIVLTDKPQKPIPDWALTEATKAELVKVGQA